MQVLDVAAGSVDLHVTVEDDGPAVELLILLHHHRARLLDHREHHHRAERAPRR